MSHAVSEMKTLMLTGKLAKINYCLISVTVFPKQKMYAFLCLFGWCGFFFSSHIIFYFNLQGRKHGKMCSINLDMQKANKVMFEKQPQAKPCSALVTFMT